jgi:uncharacterized protein (TIGR03435 family)
MNRVQCGRRALLRAVTLLAAAPIMTGWDVPLRAQATVQEWQKAAGGRQEFEVASVRENKSDGQTSSNFSLDNGNAYFEIDKNDSLNPIGTLFSAKNQTLIRYIIFAYKLSGTQELALRFDYYQGLQLHVPDWVKQDRYDIEARAPGPATKDQMRLMLQSLLADRFKLSVDWETRRAPVFALVLEKSGKLGPQLEAHAANDDCATTAFSENSGKEATGAQPATVLSALPIPCGEIAHLSPSAPEQRRFGGRNITLAMLATSMPAQTGLATLPRPVIERTGLKGEYDFSLEWAPEDMSEVDNRESGGTFREALKDQLGLKLEPQNGPVEVLIIDHIEQPSPN